MSLPVILFCHCRIANNLPFYDYKLLAEWLGVYSYIYAKNQVTPSPELGLALAAVKNGNITAAWHCYYQIENAFNSIQQREILKWILDYGRSATPADSPYIGALGFINSSV